MSAPSHDIQDVGTPPSSGKPPREKKSISGFPKTSTSPPCSDAAHVWSVDHGKCDCPSSALQSPLRIPYGGTLLGPYSKGILLFVEFILGLPCFRKLLHNHPSGRFSGFRVFDVTKKAWGSSGGLLEDCKV